MSEDTEWAEGRGVDDVPKRGIIIPAALAILAFLILWFTTGCATSVILPPCPKPHMTVAQDEEGEPGVFLNMKDIEALTNLLLGLDAGKCRLQKGNEA